MRSTCEYSLPDGQAAVLTGFQFFAAWAFYFAAAAKGRGACFTLREKELRCEEVYAPLYYRAVLIAEGEKAFEVGEQCATYPPLSEYLPRPRTENEYVKVDTYIAAARKAANACPAEEEEED